MGKVKHSCQRSFCASDMKIITLEKGRSLITANWASPGILSTTIVLTKTAPFCPKLILWTKIDMNVLLIVPHISYLENHWTCILTKYFFIKAFFQFSKESFNRQVFVAAIISIKTPCNAVNTNKFPFCCPAMIVSNNFHGQ